MPSTKPNPASRFLKFARTGLVYLLIFVLAGLAGNLWLSRHQATGPAPPVIGQNLQGDLTRLDLSTTDSAVLLYFFADWCPICKVQHSAIETVAGIYPVYAIAMQSGDLDNVRAYVREAGLEFPVINDLSGEVSASYGVHGVPASFILDRDGQIRFSTRGYASSVGLLARLWLADTEIMR